jgi:Family of unknown function (DUF6065)
MAEPFVTFYQLIPDAPAPRPADPEVLGSLPVRAVRFCEPVTAASGYGWWIYPPLDIDVTWDGHAVAWRLPGEERWQPVGDVVLSTFVDAFERRAAPAERDLSHIPVLMRGPEAGIVTLWTGLLARTAANWSILVRPLANYPRNSGYEALEGMMETDWWFGPLIATLRIVKTDTVLEFRKGRPLVQAQPVFREAYARQTIGSLATVHGIDQMSEADWQRFLQALSMRNGPQASVGSYKREVRARARSQRDPSH